MDRKQMIVADVHYQSPKGRGAAKLKGLLRYVQYRNDKDDHIPQQRGLERWVDKGLGNNFQTIAANCEAFKSQYVQGFTWVLNPNPDLVGLIPEDRRETFVRDLTESTLDTFFEARGMDTTEYSYAVHRRETTDSKQPGRDNPHSHIILPGSYESWADGARLPLYMNRNKRENHIELLHTIAQQETERLLEREIGLDWEQRYDALIAERTAQEQAQSLAPGPEILPLKCAMPDLPAHDQFIDESGQTHKVWIATRSADRQTSQVGLIASSSPEEAAFIALIDDLTGDQAAYLAKFMLAYNQQDPENGLAQAIQQVERFQSLDAEQRERFWQEVMPEQVETRPSVDQQDDELTLSGPTLDL